MADEQKPVQLIIAIRNASGEICDPKQIQIEWMRNAPKHSLNLFGGGYGSSKTTGLCLKTGNDIGKSIEGIFPPLKIACCHETHEAAYEVLVKRLFGEIDSIIPQFIIYGDRQIDLIQRMNKSDRKLYIGLPGRQPILIHWTGLDESKDLPKKFRNSGMEFDRIMCSQVDRLEETAFLAMRDRMGRRSNMPGFMPSIDLDANVCAGWPKQIFVDGDIYKGDNPDWYYFLNSKTSDNDSLDETYIARGMASPDAKQTFYGEWDSAQTLVYNQLQRRLSFVNFNDVPFAKSWRINCELDFGRWRHPFGVLYSAVDHDGNLFILSEAELYLHTARQAATKIRDMHGELLHEIAQKCGLTEPEPMMWGSYWGGPDFNRRDDDGNSVADQMARNVLDNNDTWEGISVQVVSLTGGDMYRERSFVNSLHEIMIPEEGHRHPITGETPAPRLYISDRCPRFRAQITSAEYDPEREDKVRKNEVRNKFESDQSRVHHWDLHDCGMIASQKEIYRREPVKPIEFRPGAVYIQPKKRKVKHAY
jgi:hypothetical protein